MSWIRSHWDFHNPTKIEFGVDAFRRIPEIVSGRRILFLTSAGFKERGFSKRLLDGIQNAGREVRELALRINNPSFLDLEKALKDLSSFRPDAIISCGGGSIIDLGKILSYALHPESPAFAELSMLLKAGKNVPPLSGVLPMLAVPTTSGTGSEVTPFATLWESVEKKKYSVAAPNLHPKVALLDPTLTHSLPWDITLSTGMDALSQCLESVWNRNANPLTLSLAARGVPAALEALPLLRKDLSNPQARSQLAEASLISGLCISRTRTALAHSMSYPLTAHYSTPHGIACSFTLPELWDLNWAADDGRMQAFADMAKLDGRNFAQSLRDFMRSLDFGAELRRTVKDIASTTRLVPEMFTPGRSDNNLRTLQNSDVDALLKRSLMTWELR